MTGNLAKRPLRLAAGAALGLMVAAPGGAALAAGDVVEVHKSPYCGCCAAWIDHMRAAGFEVKVTETEDLTPVKDRLGVPPELASCHTATFEGYVIEGHVPARDVKRLLAERPDAAGLSVPGMPVGSPGMEQGGYSEPYQVILFAETGQRVFARY